MPSAFLLLLCLAPWLQAEKSRPNVLFIALDDMNDWAGCLGHKQAKTPHIDRLAAQGILFTNAHTVSPLCNPARVSTLTGLYPDSSGVYTNGTVMRKKMPYVLTLPQYFQQQGYKVHGGGKIFHDVTPHHDKASFQDYYWWHPNGAKGSDTHN